MDALLGGSIVLCLVLLAAVAVAWPVGVFAHVVWRIALSGWGWA